MSVATTGTNSRGQLGDGTTANYAFPGVIYGGYSNRTVVGAAVGSSFTYVVYDSSQSCFGYLSDDYFVCGRHGQCISRDTCICENGYSGANCDTWQCNSLNWNDTTVCSGFGKCVAADTCGM